MNLNLLLPLAILLISSDTATMNSLGIYPEYPTALVRLEVNELAYMPLAAVTLLALTNPLALMLLEVVLVKKPIGLVIEVTALIVLELMAPLALMLPSTVNFSLGVVVPMPTFPVAARVIAVTGVPATLKRKYIFALTSL